jgi:hypothetical protein
MTPSTDTSAQPSPSTSNGAFALLAILVLAALGWIVYTNQTGPLGSTSSGVTLAQYHQLTDGMSYGQAVNVLGSSGTEISRSNVAGFLTVMYQWEGTHSGGNMNALFQNDRLVSKAQAGLR